ncbi:hypothetical protein [Aeromonas popoffii]|uniref:hypothetical protein n=1 Tax=Aeromonas popoffii TaxID=70856 RepID=UPI0030CAF212
MRKSLPTTRFDLALEITDIFQSFGLSGTETKIKSRGNYHQITLRFDGKLSGFGIKVFDKDIVITKGKEIWQMYSLDRNRNVATTQFEDRKPSQIHEIIFSVLFGVESGVYKIYDIAEALAELYAPEPIDWMFNQHGNLTGKMMINDIELTLDFDHLNRFSWSMTDLFDPQEIEPVSVDSSDEPSDHWYGDALWLCDGTYNYLATGFNACKTWQKLTQDLEHAFAYILSIRNFAIEAAKKN